MNYIIDFKNTVTDQDITQYLTANNCTQLKTFNHFEKVYLVSSDTLPPTTDQVETVVQDSNNPVMPLAVSESYIDLSPQQYGTEDEKSWWKVLIQKEVKYDNPTQTLSRQGKNIVVYVVDSGVNLQHPEFQDTACTNLFTFNNDFTDTNGHGTAIASVLVGNTCGITTSTVKSVKIFQQGVDTLQSDMVAAFDAILEDYISNDQKISIVNLSWSIPKNTYIENKILQLQNSGLAIICAAGNSGMPIQNVTPASMSGVMVVGSFNQDLEPSNFSNYQSESVISFTANETNTTTQSGQFGWAPGEKIYVAKKDTGYGYSAGTSMAAAVATACLAYNLGLEWTENNKLTFPLPVANIYYFNSLLFTRKDILTLGEKYNTTTNRIATISNFNIQPRENLFLNENYAVVLYGQYSKWLVYDRLKYNSISFDTLPPGLSISNGHIHGTVNSSTPEQPQQWTTTVTLSGPNEASKTLTVTITAIDAYKNRTNFPELSVSAVDPTLKISLLDDLCCTWNGSSCANVGFSCQACCNDYCNTIAFSQCVGSSKATCGCFCDCGNGETVGQCCA